MVAFVSFSVMTPVNLVYPAGMSNVLFLGFVLLSCLFSMKREEVGKLWDEGFMRKNNVTLKGSVSLFLLLSGHKGRKGGETRAS